MSGLTKIFAILDELRRRVVRILYVFFPLFGFFLTFEIKVTRVSWSPFPIPYPYPNLFYNVTAQVFLWLKATMLPPGVVLVNIGIGDSIIAQMEIGLLLALAVSMPWITHEVAAFLMPALRHNERQLLTTVAIPATGLFVTGFLLALFWLTPFTYLLLFRYVAAMGLTPFLSADSFITFTLLYTTAFGVVFEVPVFVYTLTRLRLVAASVWKKHWRGAIVGCLIFGMIITPDNSGITMLLVALPMMALYFGGVFFAQRYERRAARAIPA